MHKIFENRLIGFFSLKRNSKPLLIFYFLLLFFIFDISKAETNIPNKKNNQLEIDYLDSRNELEDYIIDTGDAISLEFFPANELSGIFPVDEEGELFLPRLDKIFVRGLTTPELKTFLEKRYAEFLINPEIKVRLAGFRGIKVFARGELKNPGFYKFPAYTSGSIITFEKGFGNDSELGKNFERQLIDDYNKRSKIEENSLLNNKSSEDLFLKRSTENITFISDVIRKAGGITSATDLSQIEIIRDIPLGKGGGKKRAIIDFNSYLNELDPTNDIRIFDGDSIFFPKLSKPNPKQISKSILSGISPKYFTVNLFGRVETPGIVKLPLGSSLSDAIDLSGPIKPLSGKIVLIRYQNDGTIIKKNISYSAGAKRGSKRNPFLKKDDLISVKNSFLGKSTGFLKEVTAPFVGIYSTKKMLDDF